MTHNERDLAGAIDDAVLLLRKPGGLSPQDEARLRELLGGIGRSSRETDPDHALRERLQALAKHLDAFQSRWSQEHPEAGPHWSTEPSFLFPG